MNTKDHFETRAIHVGQEPDPTTGAVITPVYMTSTYAQSAPGVHKGYEYSRTSNPTRKALEDCLASIENGKHGTAYASGLGATSTLLLLLPANAHVVYCDDVYGGTYRLFSKVLERRSYQFTSVDLTNLEALEKAVRSDTKMIWIESPTNPLLKIMDLEAIASFAKKRKILTVMDNTFASPFNQNPLDFGIDVVLHSTTKYIGGHSDVVGGALITNSDDLNAEIRFHQKSIGATPGPMDAYLTLRGIKTLGVRMERHNSNALKVAEFLAKHPKVEKVIYPGLTSHPQHALAKKQMRGFSGMLGVYLKSDLAKTKMFLSKLRLFTLAESLGGVESLIELPSVMTHASLPKEGREALGITDGFIRISVGIEHAEDLISDLTAAFHSL